MVEFSMIFVGGKMGFRYYIHRYSIANVTGEIEILNSVSVQQHFDIALGYKRASSDAVAAGGC